MRKTSRYSSVVHWDNAGVPEAGEEDFGEEMMMQQIDG